MVNRTRFPDVSLLPELSKIYQVDITKFLEGEMPEIKRVVDNLKNTRFYICEKCGSLLTSVGNSEIICCGRKLSPLDAKSPDDSHKISIEK